MLSTRTTHSVRTYKNVHILEEYHNLNIWVRLLLRIMKLRQSCRREFNWLIRDITDKK